MFNYKNTNINTPELNQINHHGGSSRYDGNQNYEEDDEYTQNEENFDYENDDQSDNNNKDDNTKEYRRKSDYYKQLNDLNKKHNTHEEIKKMIKTCSETMAPLSELSKLDLSQFPQQTIQLMKELEKIIKIKVNTSEISSPVSSNGTEDVGVNTEEYRDSSNPSTNYTAQPVSTSAYPDTLPPVPPPNYPPPPPPPPNHPNPPPPPLPTNYSRQGYFNQGRQNSMTSPTPPPPLPTNYSRQGFFNQGRQNSMTSPTPPSPPLPNYSRQGSLNQGRPISMTSPTSQDQDAIGVTPPVRSFPSALFNQRIPQSSSYVDLEAQRDIPIPSFTRRQSSHNLGSPRQNLSRSDRPTLRDALSESRRISGSNVPSTVLPNMQTSSFPLNSARRSLIRRNSNRL